MCHEVGVFEDQSYRGTGGHAQFAGHESQAGCRLNPQGGAGAKFSRLPSLSELPQGRGGVSEADSGQGSSERIVQEDGGRTPAEIAE